MRLLTALVHDRIRYPMAYLTQDRHPRTRECHHEGRMVIGAVRAEPHPIDPAHGYVLIYRVNTVFVSGDTMVAATILPAMQGCRS